MTDSPLTAPVVVALGPLPITLPVVVTWGLMAAMTLGAALATRRLRVERPGRVQTVLELVVETLRREIGETMQADATPFLPLLGTLFLYLAVANLSGLLPGLKAPTAFLETAAALALVVLLSAQALGIAKRGLWGYLKGFAHPTPLLLPLNLLSELTRAFSLSIRLFGNVMSGEFVIGIVLALAGLFVPVPLMALELLLGLVQAYIFTILATVFIGGAVGTIEKG
ncbi:F0F1 ATP synthase subunit A [Azospirillum sp. TSO35-2]|uniref:F0F1 ATP synthase subunit A n=1 Tax=Azospirillum sp. TSO35-2 TaxID=716796 RepID=UPI000D61E504|nr:F0F1 ATP synthase subunit A [Azospirillum sp. TSO35-2]PWC32998.1 ATP synthase F0F1 subunit A [Azospirillum sp. TSO35-2]